MIVGMLLSDGGIFVAIGIVGARPFLQTITLKSIGPKTTKSWLKFSTLGLPLFTELQSLWYIPNDRDKFLKPPDKGSL
jgi:hypothetical protein